MAVRETVIDRLSNGITIRRMSEHDLLEVVEIEEQSRLSRWGWAAYYTELQGSNRGLMLVAETAADKRRAARRCIAGYIVARQGAGELHINNVAVRDEYRRRGIGFNLLNHILDEGRNLGVNAAFLELRAGNAAALSLYKKCGFELTTRRKNYYSEPTEDALVMTVRI